MDPGIPQDALIQVSHALGIWVPRLRLQHLSSPENLRRGGASWGLRREVPEQEGGEGWSWGKPGGSPGIPRRRGLREYRVVFWGRVIGRSQRESCPEDPSPSLPYTEDCEDASRPQQLQAPLVVGGAVLLVGVHHGHIEGAGLARRQELILRGREGQTWLSSHDGWKPLPRHLPLRDPGLESASPVTLTVAAYREAGRERLSLPQTHLEDLVTTSYPMATFGKWCQAPFHSGAHPGSPGRASTEDRSCVLPQPAKGAGVRASSPSSRSWEWSALGA